MGEDLGQRQAAECRGIAERLRSVAQSLSDSGDRAGAAEVYMAADVMSVLGNQRALPGWLNAVVLTRVKP